MSAAPTRIVITGASGLVGGRLREALRAGGGNAGDAGAGGGGAAAAAADLRLISRSAREARHDGERWFPWERLDEALDGAQAVVHLAGSPVAGRRWTRAVRAELWSSRVDTTRELVAAMGRAATTPEVLLQGSAVGWYGDRGDELLDEQSDPGEGALAELSRDWEDAARPAQELGTRVAWLRTGIVLDPAGGALAKMLPIFRLGLGGRLGNGRQWMPWIHRDDQVGLMQRILADPAFRGPFNACAPEPVRNAEFTRALGAALRRPTLLPAPAFALRALFGEGAQVLLGGQRAVPAAAQALGWTPRHARIDGALAELLA